MFKTSLFITSFHLLWSSNWFISTRNSCLFFSFVEWIDSPKLSRLDRCNCFHSSLLLSNQLFLFFSFSLSNWRCNTIPLSLIQSCSSLEFIKLNASITPSVTTTSSMELIATPEPGNTALLFSSNSLFSYILPFPIFNIHTSISIRYQIKHNDKAKNIPY